MSRCYIGQESGKESGKGSFRVSRCGTEKKEKLQKHCIANAVLISGAFGANSFTLTILSYSDKIRHSCFEDTAHVLSLRGHFSGLGRAQHFLFYSFLIIQYVMCLLLNILFY